MPPANALPQHALARGCFAVRWRRGHANTCAVTGVLRTPPARVRGRHYGSLAAAAAWRLRQKEEEEERKKKKEEEGRGRKKEGRRRRICAGENSRCCLTHCCLPGLYLHCHTFTPLITLKARIYAATHLPLPTASWTYSIWDSLARSACFSDHIHKFDMHDRRGSSLLHTTLRCYESYLPTPHTTPFPYLHAAAGALHACLPTTHHNMACASYGFRRRFFRFAGSRLNATPTAFTADYFTEPFARTHLLHRGGSLRCLVAIYHWCTAAPPPFTWTSPHTLDIAPLIVAYFDYYYAPCLFSRICATRIRLPAACSITVRINTYPAAAVSFSCRALQHMLFTRTRLPSTHFTTPHAHQS